MILKFPKVIFRLAKMSLDILRLRSGLRDPTNFEIQAHLGRSKDHFWKFLNRFSDVISCLGMSLWCVLTILKREEITVRQGCFYFESKIIKFIKNPTWELFWPWRLNGGCEWTRWVFGAPQRPLGRGIAFSSRKQTLASVQASCGLLPNLGRRWATVS